MIQLNDSTLKRYIAEVSLLGNKDFVDVARESLNAAALDAKKRSISAYAKKSFTVRNKRFFSAMTKINFSRRSQSKAISGLYSEVGFFPNKKKGLTSDYNPVENLETQEHGGTLSRHITPLNESRISRSYNRAVSRTSLFNDSNMLIQSKMRGKTSAQRFRIALEVARKGGKKFVLGDEYKGIYSVRGKKIKRIFGYDKSKTNKIKATNFMQSATKESAELIPAFFIIEAVKKIEYRASKIKY